MCDVSQLGFPARVDMPPSLLRRCPSEGTRWQSTVTDSRGRRGGGTRCSRTHTRCLSWNRCWWSPHLRSTRRGDTMGGSVETVDIHQIGRSGSCLWRRCCRSSRWRSTGPRGPLPGWDASRPQLTWSTGRNARPSRQPHCFITLMQLIGVLNVKNGSITIDPPYVGLPTGHANQPTDKCPDWELSDPANHWTEKCPALKINELRIVRPCKFHELRNVWTEKCPATLNCVCL